MACLRKQGWELEPSGLVLNSSSAVSGFVNLAECLNFFEPQRDNNKTGTHHNLNLFGSQIQKVGVLSERDIVIRICLVPEFGRAGGRSSDSRGHPDSQDC